MTYRHVEKKIMIENIKRIVTHDGVAHADETFAIAALRLASHEWLDVIRTRDMTLVREGDIVIDVGGGDYDHHHDTFDKWHPEGCLKAAFGLVWADFGPAAVSRAMRDLELPGHDDVFVCAEAAERVRRELVVGVDAADNGFFTGPEHDCAAASIPRALRWVSSLANVPAPDAEIHAFETMVATAGIVLLAAIGHAAQELAAKKAIAATIAANSGPILVMDAYLPGWVEAAAATSHLIAGIFPRDNDWGIQCVPVHPKTRALRSPLPAVWGGLESPALQEAGAPKGLKFVHKNLFFAVAESKEVAVQTTCYMDSWGGGYCGQA